MNVLVLGSGGREHALSWKLSRSISVDQVYCAPGNAGIAEDVVCIDLSLDNFERIAAFIQEREIHLTVVGPEAPLVAGIVDFLKARDMRVFGPSQAAAQLEGSKSFAKDFMARHRIPSARFGVFCGSEGIAQSHAFAAANDWARVVKADGLAAGKGVVVCETLEEVDAAVAMIAKDRQFGSAGDSWIIEETLTGEEISLLALGDGRRLIPMVPSQDYKQAFEGDQGPNTGGMGSFAPVPFVNEKMMRRILDEVVRPAETGLVADGLRYTGLLYFGLMLTDSGPKVLEFNCRFGDPETQPLLMLLKSDLAMVLDQCIDGEGEDIALEWEPGATATIVLASQGYPGAYTKGRVITGLEQAQAHGNVKVFHAGTTTDGEHILTNGGRVLNVTASGPDLRSALDNAYRAADDIHFEGKQFRTDIGFRAFRHD